MAHVDKRIKVYQLHWDQKNLLKHSNMTFKNAALMQCTGDWCILQDSDEVIPEWFAEEIKSFTKRPDEAFEFKVLHFYRDFKHVKQGPNWYTSKVYMFRNFKGIHHGLWRLDNDLIVDMNGKPVIGAQTGVHVFHYGHVRSWKAYKRKKDEQRQRHHGAEWRKYEVKDWEMDSLVEYNGRHPGSMQQRIEGFVRE